jgi:hypothetical protein
MVASLWLFPRRLDTNGLCYTSTATRAKLVAAGAAVDDAALQGAREVTGSPEVLAVAAGAAACSASWPDDRPASPDDAILAVAVVAGEEGDETTALARSKKEAREAEKKRQELEAR